jgi:Calcineurin-like phosphoesterase
MDWIINNRNLPVDGVPLGIKAAISVGDCVNSASPVYGGQAEIAAKAWSRLDAAGIHRQMTPGNHDWIDGGSFGFSRDEAHLDPLWTGKNPFGAGARASALGSGMRLADSGDLAYWGGSYTSAGANTYTTMNIGDRRILMIGLEFFPRSEVLNWAREVHDAHPHHECWITTHSYLSDQSNVSTDPDAPSNRVSRGTRGPNNCWGPDAYSLGAAPASNSGEEMWHGSDASWTAGLKSFSNLTAIFSGHWIDPASDDGWYWQCNHPQSASEQGQRVMEIFANWQQLDYSTHCGTSDPAGESDSGHLMILRFREDLLPRTVEAFAVSTNSGRWYGPKGSVPAAGPIQLFSLSAPGISTLERIRGGIPAKNGF